MIVERAASARRSRFGTMPTSSLSGVTVVVDASGDVVTEATLGDGIQHVLTTGSGAVWVGYFDEGVFGNYGWGGPGPEPLGSHGLLRFNSDLQPTWHFPVDCAFGTVDDCYALNVVGESARSCYYSEFPIVRIEGGGVVTGWNNGIVGARALVVDAREDRVALIGGYGEDSARVVYGELSEGRLEPRSTHELTVPHGQSASGSVQLVARGEDLHALVGTRWFKIGIAELGT